MEDDNSVATRIRSTMTEVFWLGSRSAVLLAVYFVLKVLLVYRLRLSEGAYYGPVIAVETGKQIIGDWALLAAAIGFVGLLLFQFSHLVGRWSELFVERGVQWFVTLVVFILAWYFSTYDYNLYFDQGHYLDRLALLILVPLVFWRPIFVLPFLVLLTPVIWQFATLVPGFSWAQQLVPISILLTFLAVLITGSVWKRNWTYEFIFLAVCVLAAHYWVPGLSKFMTNWAVRDHVNFILPATYSNGWLAMLEPETIGRLARWSGNLNPVLKAVTLFVELGILFAFWRRKLLIVLLAVASMYHVGVWSMSGIFFWKWILIELALIGILSFANRDDIAALFTKPRMFVAMVVIGFGSVWFAPANLTWQDTRLNYSYRVEAIADDGSVLQLHPRFMEPYDYQFTLSGFHFLDQRKNLGIVWGSTRNSTIADDLLAARSVQDVTEIEERLGQIRYNEKEVEKFNQFLRQFAASYNKRRDKKTPFSFLGRIPQLWTFPVTAVPDGSERINRVNVYRQTTFFDDFTVLQGERYLVTTVRVD